MIQTCDIFNLDFPFEIADFFLLDFGASSLSSSDELNFLRFLNFELEVPLEFDDFEGFVSPEKWNKIQ